MTDTRQDESGRLKQLAAFAGRFRDPAATFGSFDVAGAGLTDFVPSKLADDFVRMAYEIGWVDHKLDWAAWVRGADGQRLVNDATAIKNATPDELRKLLTACIRQDRFVDGSLEARLKDGLLLAVAERADALCKEIE